MSSAVEQPAAAESSAQTPAETQTPTHTPTPASSTSATVEKQDIVPPTAPAPKLSLSDKLSTAKLGAYLAYEAAMHAAYLRNAKHGWDLRTHLFVSAVRQFMNPVGKTVEQIQELSQRGLPLNNDKIEIIDCCIPAPTGSDAEFVLGTVAQACSKLAAEAGVNEPTIDAPSLADVRAEWVIHGRENKEDKFTCAKDDIVVIYAHGGAHYMGSASAHRFMTSMFAEFANARVLSVDYRLAPQSPMPASITDFFVAYMYVLETLKVPCTQICFAGDSSGGAVNLATLATILYGQMAEKRVPVPAGIVAISPFVDMTRCLPSESSKEIEKFDYIPGSNFYPQIKKSAVWPAENGRYWPYAENNAITHPFASPINTPSWAGACPILIVVSEERLRDAAILFAKFYKEAGNPTYLYYHEKLPHVFHFLGKDNPSVFKSMTEIGSFIRDVSASHSEAKEEAPLESKFVMVGLKGDECALPERRVSGLTRAEVAEKMEKRVGELDNLLKYVVRELYPKEKK
ncbi:Alpha/Beta hydrolase protein [Myxozyma melibiosi]|uniref:Alpha/Beta hydrolase protein n=1 Tax=Myxozyma melibiosi TaxID=54550 RepID=A0ABR1F391_9ASCO